MSILGFLNFLNPLPPAASFKLLEANETETDDNAPPATFAVTAGGAIDTGKLVVNQAEPNAGPNFPTNLGLEDDDSVEVALPFTFTFYGIDYNSVHINANGNVTFGDGDSSFEFPVEDFLDGPPRVCGLCKDLLPLHNGDLGLLPVATPTRHQVYTRTIPASGGDPAKFFILWLRVPSINDFDGYHYNTLVIQLNSLNRVRIRMRKVTAENALVGITPGEGAFDPGEKNFTNAATSNIIGGVGESLYESFEEPGSFDPDVNDPFDLSGRVVVFIPKGSPAGSAGYDVAIRCEGNLC
jgi:hypothetical protein